MLYNNNNFDNMIENIQYGGWVEVKKHTILIVEDEKKIARFLQLELEHEGYDVIVSYDGRSGLEMAEKEKVSLILLDVMLPSLNGMEVCRRIRQFSDVPIIMLTAKDETMDKVMGLDTGADDYVTKPFAIEEVLARIRTILKRRKKEDPIIQKYNVKGLELDVGQHILSYKGSTIELTKKEFDLIQYMMENQNRVLSRDQIVERVWGYDFIGDTNIVDVYIRYLRSKIDEPFNEKLIYTVRGVGYILKNV